MLLFPSRIVLPPAGTKSVDTKLFQLHYKIPKNSSPLLFIAIYFLYKRYTQFVKLESDSPSPNSIIPARPPVACTENSKRVFVVADVCHGTANYIAKIVYLCAKRAVSETKGRKTENDSLKFQNQPPHVFSKMVVDSPYFHICVRWLIAENISTKRPTMKEPYPELQFCPVQPLFELPTHLCMLARNFIRAHKANEAF